MPPGAAFELVPGLLMFPDIVQAYLQSLRIPDVEILQRIGILEVPNLLGVLADLLQVLPVSALVHYDDALARIAVSPPIPIVLMKTDRRRQPILRPEIVDGAGLAKIARLDGSFGLHFRWQ